MSSPTDYIFMNSRDKGFVIVNILSSSRISIGFMMRNTILASMNCIIIDHFIAFPPTQACSCLVLYLEFLAIQQLFFFTLEYYHPLCQECSEICSTSWEFLTWKYFSPSPFFLGPRVNSNKWTVLFGFFPSSNPIFLKLMVESSFLGYWLLNHHSDIGRATQPIFRAHLSTNV